jgi:hypothetical protein
MCLWRAPEKYITGAMGPVVPALDRVDLDLTQQNEDDSKVIPIYLLFASCCVGIQKVHNFNHLRNNPFIKLISLHVSTPLGHLQVLTILIIYLIDYNASIHVPIHMH